jgi:hypothetical protein
MKAGSNSNAGKANGIKSEDIRRSTTDDIYDKSSGEDETRRAAPSPTYAPVGMCDPNAESSSGGEEVANEGNAQASTPDEGQHLPNEFWPVDSSDFLSTCSSGIFASIGYPTMNHPWQTRRAIAQTRDYPFPCFLRPFVKKIFEMSPRSWALNAIEYSRACAAPVTEAVNCDGV